MSASSLVYRLLFFGFFLSQCQFSLAQLGGNAVFPFLRTDPSATAAAMGGAVIALPNGDLSTSLPNPATLSHRHHQHVSFNYTNYFGDINFGNVAYAHHFDREKRKWTLAGQLQYMDYGSFDGYDETGMETGTFTSSDLKFGVYASTQLNEKWSVGISSKFIYSVLETYISTGAASDLGFHYRDTQNNLYIGAVYRNIGYQLLPYRGTERAPLPSDLSIAATYKLKHAPFRITAHLHNLQKWDLTYNYTDPFNRRISDNNTVIEKRYSLADKAFRHLNVATEILLSENFSLRVGYNHQRRRELGTAVRMGVAGFSWGIAFKVSKLQLSYGSAGFFPGYNSNLFSIHLNLQEFYK